MHHKSKYSILIDAREFVASRFTGIGRVLEGFVKALAGKRFLYRIVLAVHSPAAIPPTLKKGNIECRILPGPFLPAEKALSALSGKGFDLFISPYPKLPLFGTHCPAINTVHDVFYITHPAYRKRFRTLLDRIRLIRDLKRADLTWYDSRYSVQETRKLAGITGKNARLRYPGLGEKFDTSPTENEKDALGRHQLQSGYILIVGNGLPHKNLGALLEIEKKLKWQLVMAGVSKERQRYWKGLFPETKVYWLTFVEDNDLPVLIRNAFCIAQPSTAEGYGFPPLEAMACGVPAVISSIPVLVETTGGNALTADPHRPETWLSAIIKLENSERYQLQVKKGLKWSKRFQGRKGWENYLLDIEDLLRRT